MLSFPHLHLRDTCAVFFSSSHLRSSRPSLATFVIPLPPQQFFVTFFLRFFLLLVTFLFITPPSLWLFPFPFYVSPLADPRLFFFGFFLCPFLILIFFFVPLPFVPDNTPLRAAFLGSRIFFPVSVRSERFHSALISIFYARIPPLPL